MAEFHLVALLRFVLDTDDLVVPILVDDLALDDGAGQGRSADGRGFLIAHIKRLERELGADLPLEFLDFHLGSDGYEVLFPAGLDHCQHMDAIKKK